MGMTNSNKVIICEINRNKTREEFYLPILVIMTQSWAVNIIA